MCVLTLRFAQKLGFHIYNLSIWYDLWQLMVRSNYFCPKQYSVVPYQASSNLKVRSTLKEPWIVVKKYWFLVFRMV